MINPLIPSKDNDDKNNPAVNLIRHKLDELYDKEPSAKQEVAEAKIVKPRSKHQDFVYQLATSGKDLAEIQTAWHNYYVGLPDEEKYKVWEEFYEVNAQTSHYGKFVASTQPPPEAKKPAPAEETKKPAGPVVVEHIPNSTELPPKGRNAAAIKQQILNKVGTRAITQAKRTFKSLAFGLTLGFIVIIIFLFSFFNEIIIAPFIQPSRTVSATPLIIDASTTTSSGPEVIIPKINVEIPVDYTQTSDDPAVIESALENGVVHYPNTVFPGQNGNAAFFGHSSNNIFNPGQYKFAFVLLHTLVKGDTFYLTYNSTVYVYQVIATKVVSPDYVSVLNQTLGNPATATLITCDPPGTSINRLVVTGVQISPNPSANTATPTTTTNTSLPATLASNGPSLWNRFTNWLF